MSAGWRWGPAAGFGWAKETRGCIGCHEDPERIPGERVCVGAAPPFDPLGHHRTNVGRSRSGARWRVCCVGTAPRSSVTAAETPRCICRWGGDRSTDAGLEESFAALMAPAEAGARPGATAPLPGRYVDAGRARTSWLIWQLVGQNTARAWDYKAMDALAGSREVRQMPPAAGAGDAMRAESVRTIIQWIDLGAPLDPVEGRHPPRPRRRVKRPRRLLDNQERDAMHGPMKSLRMVHRFRGVHGGHVAGLLFVLSAAEPPWPTFTDVTESAGLRFKHSLGDLDMSNCGSHGAGGDVVRL